MKDNINILRKLKLKIYIQFTKYWSKLLIENIIALQTIVGFQIIFNSVNFHFEDI